MKFTLFNVVTAGIVSAILFFGLPINAAFAAEKYYGGHLCGYEGFKCVKVKSGDTWAKLFPNKKQREIVKRLNRTNMSIRHRPWIVVPVHLDGLSYMDLSPFPDYIGDQGGKLIIVNLALQAFGAYDKEGYLVHWGAISGGRGWCADAGQECKTATGEYRIFRKQGPGCVSVKFPLTTGGGAPMPYCMHYYRAFALHGSTLPGYHASHGCVRLFFEDAKWLNKNFVDLGTKIFVTEDGSDVDFLQNQ